MSDYTKLASYLAERYVAKQQQKTASIGGKIWDYIRPENKENPGMNWWTALGGGLLGTDMGDRAASEYLKENYDFRPKGHSLDKDISLLTPKEQSNFVPDAGNVYHLNKNYDLAQDLQQIQKHLATETGKGHVLAKGINYLEDLDQAQRDLFTPGPSNAYRLKEGVDPTTFSKGILKAEEAKYIPKDITSKLKELKASKFWGGARGMRTKAIAGRAGLLALLGGFGVPALIDALRSRKK